MQLIDFINVNSICILVIYIHWWVSSHALQLRHSSHKKDIRVI